MPKINQTSRLENFDFLVQCVQQIKLLLRINDDWKRKEYIHAKFGAELIWGLFDYDKMLGVKIVHKHL